MVTEKGPSLEDHVGKALLDWGFITNQQLEEADLLRKERGAGLLDTLLYLGVVSRETLVTILISEFKMPKVALKNVPVDPRAAKLMPEESARQHKALPLAFVTDDTLLVATDMPSDRLLSYLTQIIEYKIRFALTSTEGMEELINRTYPPEAC